MIVLGLLALGMFTAIAGVNLLIGEVTTVARGTASALYLCCYYIGGSIGAVAPGLAWQQFAWPGVIILCLCLALAALAADDGDLLPDTPRMRILAWILPLGTPRERATP